MRVLLAPGVVTLNRKTLQLLRRMHHKTLIAIRLNHHHIRIEALRQFAYLRHLTLQPAAAGRLHLATPRVQDLPYLRLPVVSNNDVSSLIVHRVHPNSQVHSHHYIPVISIRTQTHLQ